jgi:hypothetical protein
LAVWKVPRQCPLVLLVKDLINFEFKDVGAAVVSGMESKFGRAIGSNHLLFFDTTQTRTTGDTQTQTARSSHTFTFVFFPKIRKGG